MASAYFGQGKAADTSTFDLYFRRNPFGGGYAIAAGLEAALRDLEMLRFSEEDLEYLGALRSSSSRPLFGEAFLEYLRGFRFRGAIRAVPEGTVVFPNEPIVQVRGNLIECQIVESIVLCHVNFQTLVATKAARIWEASRRGHVVEFGLRRAQGPDGALSACRAAFIGGAEATSNVLGASTFGIPSRGTHAHSLVQSFDSELDAFRAFARSFPDDCVLLVDSYDVLKSGVPNAIRVARELESRGHRLAGIRIDSGDLAFLSRQARGMLDDAGLQHVKIVASNELDEYLIETIIAEGARIDIWGVGTNLVTGGGAGGGALGGVYKLVEHNGCPKIKLSGNPEKMTNPGYKRVYRLFGEDGLMEADALASPGECLGDEGILIVDPSNPVRRKTVRPAARVELLQDFVIDGQIVCDLPPLEAIRDRRREQLDSLHESYRRLHNPHEYKVGLTLLLWQQKEQMLTREAVRKQCE